MKKLSEDLKRRIISFKDKYTQQELANIFKLSQGTISKVLNEKPKFKPFDYPISRKEELEPYYCRGRFVGNFTKEVINDLQNDFADTFNETQMWKRRALGVTIAYGILVIAVVVLILGIVL